MGIVAAKTPQSFRLKGSLFTLTMMQLFNSDIDIFEAQLIDTIQQAPKFFEHTPIVIDLNDYDENATQFVNLKRIQEIMRENTLIPIGIRGGSVELQAHAQEQGLAILSNKESKKASVASENKTTTSKAPTNPDDVYQPSTVITTPVRSGQQIYAKDSDLIILSSVGHGAEVLADGHIHVYGTMRGRALAGIMGNTSARIFCKSLDAELISIAGRYLVSEQLEGHQHSNGLHMYLDGEQLLIKDF